MIENNDYLDQTTKDKLERFRKSIFSESKAKADEIIAQAQKTAAQILNTSEDMVLNTWFEQISNRTKEIKQEFDKQVAHKSFEANRMVFRHRNKLIEELFTELQEEILAFTATSDYRALLADMIQNVNREKPFKDGVVLLVKPTDLENVKEMTLEFDGVQIQGDSRIKLGGLIFRYGKENFYLDKTLDKRFEEQKQDFVKREELRL